MTLLTSRQVTSAFAAASICFCNFFVNIYIYLLLPLARQHDALYGVGVVDIINDPPARQLLRLRGRTGEYMASMPQPAASLHREDVVPQSAGQHPRQLIERHLGLVHYHSLHFFLPPAPPLLGAITIFAACRLTTIYYHIIARCQHFFLFFFVAGGGHPPNTAAISHMQIEISTRDMIVSIYPRFLLHPVPSSWGRDKKIYYYIITFFFVFHGHNHNILW